MPGSLIKGVLYPWASCGTPGGGDACVYGAVGRGRAWSLADKMALLCTGLKGDLEITVPRVGGKKA